MPNDTPTPVPQTWTFDSAHMAWLACFGCLLHKTRCEGLASIEGMVDEPQREGSVFKLFPQVMAQPYLDFATDLLRLAVGGNFNAPEIQVYANHAMAGFAEAGADTSLLTTIYLTFWASISGYSPNCACEFGRQAIPVKIKPSFFDVEKVYRQTSDAWRPSPPRDNADLDAQVDAFVETLNG